MCGFNQTAHTFHSNRRRTNARRYCASRCPRCHLAGQKPVLDALMQLVQVTCYEMDMRTSVTNNLLRLYLPSSKVNVF